MTGKNRDGDELATIPVRSHAMAYAPQTGLLAFATQDFEKKLHQVKVVDLNSGKEINRFSLKEQDTGELAFSADGSLLAAGTVVGGSVPIWNVKSGKTVNTVRASRVTFAPKGKQLAAVVRDANSNNNLQIQDAETGQLIQSFRSFFPSLPVFSPSGAWLASGEGTKVILWDIASGDRIQELVLGGPAIDMAFTPDSWGLVICHRKSQFGGGTRIIVWDLEKNLQRTVTENNGWFNFLELAPDGKVLATQSEGLTLLDVASGKEVRRVSQFELSSRPLFFPGGMLVATGGSVIRFWSYADLINPRPEVEYAKLPPKDLKREAQLAAERDKRRVALKPIERKILGLLEKRPVPNNDLGGLSFIDGFPPLAFSPDLTVVACMRFDDKDSSQRILIYDLLAGKVRHLLHAGKENMRSLVFAQDGSLISVNDKVRIWDMKTGQLKKTMPNSNMLPQEFEFSAPWYVVSPNAKFCATAKGRRPITITDLETGKEIARGLKPFTHTNLAFSATGNRLATAVSTENDEKKILVWEVPSRKVIGEIAVEGFVEQLVFSPDEWSLAITSNIPSGNGQLLLWDLETNGQRKLAESKVHMCYCTFSPDGKALVFCDQSDTAFLDLPSGKEFHRISNGRNSPVFSPGGEILAIGTFFYDAAYLLDPRNRTDPKALAELRTWSDVFMQGKSMVVRPFEDKATDEFLAKLKQFPRLTELDLAYMDKITDAGLANLKDLPNLQKLRLSGSREITDADLAHLEGLTSLKILSLWDIAKVTDAGLEHLKNLKSLQSLKLYNTNVSAVGLAHLKSLSQLQRLLLSGPRIDDQALANIAGLTNLTELFLVGSSKISDAGLAHLKNLKQLKILDLGSTAITGSGFSNIARLNELTDLNLSFSKVGDAGLAHLKDLAKLRNLNLFGTAVTDAGLVHLANLKCLKELKLWGVKGLKGPGLEHLKGLTGIDHLDLYDTGVDDSGLSGIKNLTHLKDLVLPQRIKGPGLQHLKGLTGITNLNLYDTAIDDAGLANIKDLAHLQGLTLPRQTTDDGLAHIAGLVNLQSLKLNLPKLKGPGLSYLKNLSKIQALYLTSTGITDESLECVKDLKQIKELALPKQITDAGVAHLKGMVQLNHLNLYETKITDAALDQLHGLTNLETIFLQGTKVSDAAIDRLKKAIPRVNVIK
jgi:WD40 repeat protein